MVKGLPCNAADMGSVPGWGTEIPQPEWETKIERTTRESGTTMKTQHVGTRTRCNQIN